MKQAYLFRFITLAVLCFITWVAVAQNPNSDSPIAQLIAQRQRSGVVFETFRPFSPVQQGNFKQRSDLQTLVNQAIIAQLNRKTLSEIMAYRNEHIRLSLPMPNGENVALLLFKAQVLTDNFRLTLRDARGEYPANYTPGAYYRGIIENDPNSIAAISFFGNGDVMGIFSNKDGNYVIGELNDQSKQFIIYNDRDLRVANPFTCQVQDEQHNSHHPLPDAPDATLRSGACGKMVRAYLECDFELYTAKSSNVTTTTNYATGMYNNVATIYQNESISTQTSEVYVWTSADPFPFPNGSNAGDILDAFGSLRQDTFNGDLAHLISGANSGSGYSGLAWLGVLCSTYWAVQQSGRFAYSNIAHTYQTVPTYSWSVGCVTHEMGHNLGSEHTHSCCWAGGPIDNCVAVEACGATSCSPGPAPTNGGTIMSYCHITGVGTNFNNGFGTLPGNLIRSEVNNASCLPGDVPPIASYNNTPVSGLNVSFTHSSSGTNNTYAWNFGDAASGASNTAVGATATHTYTAEGTYSVTLTVTNDCGSDSEVKSIVVSNYTPPVLCSGAQILNTCSGTITDGSVGSYNDNMSCSWLIAPAGASAVTLNITAFNTESGWDYVKVYDGSNATGILLGSYSGATLPPTLTANSGQMFVTFTSDITVVADGFTANYSCTIPVPTGNRLLAKTFLEGTYNSVSGNMSSTLGSALPTSQPYNTTPWSFNGAASINATNANIVDWVLVELRSAIDGTSLVERRAALLYTDGSIRHTDGTAGANFETVSGNYFVVIRHRNHLPIISSTPVTLPNATAYDFTDAVSKVQGGDASVRNINGVYCAKAGDFNSNGIINYADYNTAYIQFVSGNSNYISSDVTLDNNLNNTDFNLYLNNIGAIAAPILRY